VSVHVTIRIDAREDVIVEGLCKVLNHWILTGQQLVQYICHCGGSDPFTGVNTWTEKVEDMNLSRICRM